MEDKKNIFSRVASSIRDGWRWIQQATKRDGNPMTDAKPPYDKCLNCGTELTGMYCHKCGQHAGESIKGLWEFVKEYIKNVLFIERQSLPTLLNLMFHPGHLIKDYCAGRYASYLHPLKLNFLVLLVLLALFSFIGTDSKVKNSFADLTSRELFISEIVLSTITEDEEYLAKIESSPRDTLKLVASYIVIERYKQVVDVVDVISITEYEEPDTLIASVPRVLLDDRMLVERSGEYYFSHDNDIMDEAIMLNEVTEAWSAMTSLLFSHFPLLMFLTTPFLVGSIRLIFRRRDYPRAYFYIFSLYYMAFVEMVIIVFYLLGMIFDISFGLIQPLLIIALLAYLTMALKQVYDVRSWFKSVIAAVLINTIYFSLCVMMVLFISLCVVIYAFA